jgi:predicted dehydrogenase
MGNMGKEHSRNVALRKLCPSVELVAVADIAPDPREWAKKNLPASITVFDDAEKMMDSGLIDTVIIAVPHYLHPHYAKLGFKKGLNVLTEKPAGVYTRQVREMNEAAALSGVKFGIMFNQRTDPLYSKAYEIVHSGQLGNLKRMVWIITNWYRTQAYYDSGTWRGSWNGEGGGVLLNQAPHNLDLWQWICGMPKRIHANCTVGKFHNIGVEDDVTIFGEYENGATATFITTTGELPGTNRLEISGELGKIVVEGGKLKWWKLEKNERDICFNEENGFYDVAPEYVEIEAEIVPGHPMILENFAKSILRGERLISPGEDGINSLTLSNAAYLSAWTGRTVELPLCEEEFEKHLNELRANEKPIQKKAPRTVDENHAERWKVRW